MKYLAFTLFLTISIAMLVTTSIVLENPNTPMVLIIAMGGVIVATAAMAVAHLND